MQNTQKLRLRKPDGSDYYNIGDQNHNMDILDDAVTSGELQHIRVMTQAAFEALTVKSSTTMYLVTNSGAVTAYLGSTPIGGSLVECTQDQYDSMQTHDANTLYAIPEVTD